MKEKGYNRKSICKKKDTENSSNCIIFRKQIFAASKKKKTLCLELTGNPSVLSDSNALVAYWLSNK